MNEQIRKYECIDGVMYYRYRFMDKTQFKFADLDKVPFLEAHEIVGYLPVVLCNLVYIYYDDTFNQDTSFRSRYNCQGRE